MFDDIRSRTRGMNGVTLPIVSLGIIRLEDSGAVRNASIKLHSETQVSGCLGMSGGRSPRHAQNPLSGERRKKLSITYHVLSPQPLHHHLYIIHLINWLQRFYRITMSLERPFVPKSDVKRWFTTTSSLYYWLIPVEGMSTFRNIFSLKEFHHLCLLRYLDMSGSPLISSHYLWYV